MDAVHMIPTREGFETEEEHQEAIKRAHENGECLLCKEFDRRYEEMTKEIEE